MRDRWKLPRPLGWPGLGQRPEQLSPMSGLRGPEEEDPSHEVGSGGQSRKKGSVKSGRVRNVHKKIEI